MMFKNWQLYVPFYGSYKIIIDFEYLFRTEKIASFFQLIYLLSITYFLIR